MSSARLPAEKAPIEIWSSELEPVLTPAASSTAAEDAGRLHAEVVAPLKLIGASDANLYLKVPQETP